MPAQWTDSKFSDFLTPVRRKAAIDPTADYKMVTLPLYGRGAKLRKIARGSDLGTAKFEVKAGDLMISKIDARKGSNSLLPPELDGAVVTGDFLSYTIDEDVVSLPFFDIIVRSPMFAELCDTVSAGTTNRVRLDVGRFLTLSLPIPSLPEQRRIVDLIGSLDEAIEAADEAARVQQDSFETILASLIGVVPDQPGVNQMADLVEIFDCEHKTAPAEQHRPYARSIGTPDIRNGRILAATAKPVSAETYKSWTARAEPRESDVILTREAPVGQVGIVSADLGPICLGQRTVLLRSKDQSDLSGEYLWLTLLSRSYQHWMKGESIGLTVARVNVKTLAKLRIAVPSSDQQAHVIGVATAALNAADETADYATHLRNLRSNLLTALLSGEHEIPDSYDTVLEAAA